MSTHSNNCGCTESYSTGNGYLIVLVVFILLAIILGSYFIF